MFSLRNKLPSFKLKINEKLLSMNYFILVEILQSRHNLSQIVLSFHFSESLPSFDELVESVIGAYFQQNVHIFMVFEHVLKFHNVIVI